MQSLSNWQSRGLLGHTIPEELVTVRLPRNTITEYLVKAGFEGNTIRE